MRAGPIAHLAEVGKLAAREQHELGNAFTFKPSSSTNLAFRAAAGSMAADPQGAADQVWPLRVGAGGVRRDAGSVR
jgi:hypothetical protein